MRAMRCPRAAWIGVAAWLSACGGAEPSPFFDDARFLRFGVDPKVEAAAVESQLRRAGFEVRERLEGPHHVALGLVESASARSAIRVVTSRGTVLSLDSDAQMAAPRDYALITTQQLDHVPRLPVDQVFVRVSGERAAVSCIAVFAVSSQGSLARVVVDAGAVISDGCASEITDIHEDGAIELVVQAVFSIFALDDPPMLRVPLSWQGNGYRLVMGVGPMLALLSEQRAQVTQELSAARHALDVERAFRCAVELAAVSRFEGASVGDQLKVFDQALRGLVLTGRQASLLEQARQLIRQDWSEAAPDAPNQQTPDTPAIPAPEDSPSASEPAPNPQADAPPREGPEPAPTEPTPP